MTRRRKRVIVGVVAVVVLGGVVAYNVNARNNSQVAVQTQKAARRELVSVVSASGEEVFFLDQHVAHERVIFERLRRELARGAPASQALLFQESVDLGPAARALLERWREPLERLGFAFEGFGGDAVVVSAVPALLKGDEPKRLIQAAADELGGPKAGEPALDRALAFVACRAAVKANMPLEREEMERLVAELGATETPYFCPHGRPIVSRVSLADIRRELKRNW